MTDKELIRRALLGDHEAQQECTEKGIVLPCWRCGGESETQELHTGGKPIYAVTCKKTYCGAYGCAHSTQQKAIEYWNTRPALPVIHAKWEWHGPCRDSKGTFWATCSVCKTRQRIGDYENYCPKCGAKCDLEDEK